jgi:hypothetical protein
VPEALDASRTYLIVEATEKVDFFPRLSESPPTESAIRIDYAKRRAPRKEEYGPDGALLHGIDLVWHLWRVLMIGQVPKIGDVIRDLFGVRWTILNLDIQTFKERYRCQCSREPQ